MGGGGGVDRSIGLGGQSMGWGRGGVASGGGRDLTVKTMHMVVFSPPYLSLRGFY